MKKIQLSSLHLFNKCLIMLLSLFSICAFTSCVKYGTGPSSDFDYMEELYQKVEVPEDCLNNQEEPQELPLNQDAV